jgi:uncharacterized protein (TIGR00369 family)
MLITQQTLQCDQETKMEESRSGVTLETLEKFISLTPFAIMLGAKVEYFEPGKVSLSITLKKELTQHHGFAHGAVVGFMADSALAWSAASIVGDVVTSEYKINLLAPAIGERLFAKGEVIKASNRQVVARADVYAEKDGKRKIVATSLATIAVIQS